MLNLEVSSDYERIKQIFLNLISNSLKFTFHGSITLSGDLLNQNNKSFMKFKVIDTGIGIKREDQSKLFKLFGMIDESQNIYNQNGCGIGLTVSK